MRSVVMIVPRNFPSFGRKARVCNCVRGISKWVHYAKLLSSNSWLLSFGSEVYGCTKLDSWNWCSWLSGQQRSPQLIPCCSLTSKLLSPNLCISISRVKSCNTRLTSLFWGQNFTTEYSCENLSRQKLMYCTDRLKWCGRCSGVLSARIHQRVNY